MKQIITTEKRPIKLWFDEVDADALDQAKKSRQSLIRFQAYRLNA